MLPSRPGGQRGPVASWITGGGWAGAAEEVLGKAWIVSDSAVLAPEEALARATTSGVRRSAARRWRSLLPETPITFLKDLRNLLAGLQAYRRQDTDFCRGYEIVFVWQRHELFRRCGYALARKLEVPLVLSVHGLHVSEARGWGIRRPGWGRLTERWGEEPQLFRADVLVCVSEQVAADVVEKGVPKNRVLVAPNGVDTERFRPEPADQSLRDHLGLSNKFVVVWLGSFHGFHGLDQAIDAMEILEGECADIALLLVGDGVERWNLESRVSRLGLQSVTFTGMVPFEQVPRYLNACDAGILLAPEGGSSHYSPVKLREYMACGLPVIAHNVGEASSMLQDGKDAVLVPPGDPTALASAMKRLALSAELYQRLQRQGLATVDRKWSWKERVRELLQHLGDRR